MLKGKKILIGITASIAAYKIPILVRLLIREGAEVKVVMTKAACDFVTPLTLSALSQHPVAIQPFNESDGTWHSHIELGSWADLYLLAPLSANTMAKMSTGITDNLLTATYLAARCPVFFAPAMDVDMYLHPTTQANIKTLQSFGNHLIAPTEGELASGLCGYGRMEEPEAIVRILADYFSKTASMKGMRLLVSSGPTREAIDPVRFISNHSSGLMGNSIVREALNRGAEVTLVSGPVHELPVHPNLRSIKVTTAAEMYDACVKEFPSHQCCIMAAAVADYVPSEPSGTKIKKKEESLTLQLQKSKDILAELGRMKRADQFLAGFALETDNEIEHALSKLHTKNLDLIVLNSLRVEGAGFESPTNQVTILDKAGNRVDFELKDKAAVAADLLDYIGSVPFDK